MHPDFSREEVLAVSEHAIALDPQRVADLSLVDLAYEILKSTNKPFNYRDIMQEVARLKGLTEQQVNAVIARLYTEINIDGRFICIGSNVWGLKRWYPTEKTGTDKAGGKKFVRKDMDEDDDYYDDEEEVEEEEADDDSPFGEYQDGEEKATTDAFEEDEEEEAADEEETPELEEEEEELDTYGDDDDF
jgi:DNA-directed RNA polymerase subunit delta